MDSSNQTNGGCSHQVDDVPAMTSHDLGDLRPDTTLRAQLRSAKAADASGECMKDGEMTNMIHISMVFISIDVRSLESIIYHDIDVL
jgi:hypothetical protein